MTKARWKTEKANSGNGLAHDAYHLKRGDQHLAKVSYAGGGKFIFSLTVSCEHGYGDTHNEAKNEAVRRLRARGEL